MARYNFEDMYAMLSEETKAIYSKSRFYRPIRKIYQDLEFEELEIDYTLPEHPEPEKGEDITYPTTFPFTVKQQSIVGEIKFNAEITMVERIIQVDEDTEK